MTSVYELRSTGGLESAVSAQFPAAGATDELPRWVRMVAPRQHEVLATMRALELPDGVCERLHGGDVRCRVFPCGRAVLVMLPVMAAREERLLRNGRLNMLAILSAMYLPPTLIAGIALLFALGRVRASDAETSAWAEIKEHGAYPFITDHLTLYRNQTNDVLQSFSLNGVYQGLYWGVNADQGNASGWENRRMYLGGGAEFFHQFSVQGQVKFGETLDPVYDGLHTAFLTWTPHQAISLSLGRLDYFSFAGPEKSVAGTRISTFERGLVVNQVMPSEIVGALFEGKQSRFSGHAGMVSGSTTDAFTEFDGGFGSLAGLNYDLPLCFERGSLNLDYVFNNGNRSNNALKPFDHVVTLWYEARAGPFGLGLELIGGHGLDDRPAVFGLTAMSTWRFVKGVLRKDDAFQAVLRCQFDVSDGDNGLALQQRYEQDVVSDGYGDRYQAVYAGINYLIHGQRLKLMSGVEYSVMHDAANDGGAFNGWTFLTGVRLNF